MYELSPNSLRHVSVETVTGSRGAHWTWKPRSALASRFLIFGLSVDHLVTTVTHVTANGHGAALLLLGKGDHTLNRRVALENSNSLLAGR